MKVAPLGTHRLVWIAVTGGLLPCVAYADPPTTVTPAPTQTPVPTPDAAPQQPAVAGQTPPPPTQTPASTPTAPDLSDDRISLSADATSLTHTHGGGGGAVGWLHNFNADLLAGVAVEHQVLAQSHWTFGSVNGSASFGAGDLRSTVYGEAHEGAGDDGPRAFTYRIEALGLIETLYHRLSLQAEDRQVDVETTHGNLPKAGLSYLWNPHILTTVSYQYSVSGNLGTRLTSLRLDLYGSKVNFLAGGAFGQASPTILGLGFVLPPTHLSEGYVGITKPFPKLRGDLSFVLDYQDISGYSGISSSKRIMGTVSYIFHVGHTRPSR